MREAGLNVRLVPQPFPQPLGARRFDEVWRRQIRWSRLRRASFRTLYCAEIAAGGFVPLAAAFFLTWAGAMPAWGMLTFAGVWYGAEALLSVRMRWPITWRMPLLWLARDAMLPVLWAAAMVGDGFDWRGNAMSVKESQDVAGSPEVAPVFVGSDES